jgi:hypothetical protein
MKEIRMVVIYVGGTGTHKCFALFLQNHSIHSLDDGINSECSGVYKYSGCLFLYLDQ